MSFFGKNIKKIRGVKGLSQQAFAELFDLKRGTLGAYEEGRSEPKIETIIKIANHFSIAIDDLLTNELTVNQLLKFKGDLTTYAEDVKREKFAIVPCITESTANDYITLYNTEGFIKELPTMQLPVNPTKEFRGYTVSNLEMTSHDKGFYPKDVVIGEKVPPTVIKKLNNGTLVFVVVENRLIFRRLYVLKGNAVLRADHKNIEDSSFPISDIKEVWRVRYAFFRRIPEFGDLVEDKLLLIEQELLRMKEKLK
ncbi:transcriptional regulator with XRE-family HTH domain [Aquimarina sp. EL_43]|uniref:helix-turn-helix domain-containing protein n=1 Tax=unclassified Aquimarina TaxID=2627091 RepID=UPI0018CB2856|nr:MULTISPECIES: helix-turn-helix transcriptional regulator [unclassified Aquimarina]MBG6133024.1 transcriptional regulator with XRE-family HTH domain [Aquimarina sp. EL_35]MBG6152335.1 transcriptional regulator with XRE-family HTH domain [Aquimarina sp. EL_32]MBG6171173.1 transcriptional regulator with XRE-family HTH domain [Aquimarina sp. EL_43]